MSPRLRLVFVFLIPAFFLRIPSAQAFPEMVRKGYQSCISCHVSPSGGGVLTDYGREISKDVLATWGREGEENFLHGGVKLPDFLKIGGDIRRVQSYVDTPFAKTGRWFLMQANVESAVILGPFTAVASLDYDIRDPGTESDNRFASFKHYLQWQFTDEISVRAGKFLKNFGLMIPDHTSQIRRGLGFDEGSETYNAEINSISEKYGWNLAYVGGRPDVTDVISEKGVVLGGSYYFGTANRFGGSFYQGRTTDETDKRVFGPNWTLSYNKTWYWLGEADILQLKPRGGEDTSGFVSYNKIGYEVFRGADVFAVHELKKNDFDAKYFDFIGYGPGFQWSPRPHFIFTGQWQKQLRPSANKPRTIDSAYLVVQYAI